MDNNTISVLFSGSIPRHYDDFLGPMFFEPYAVEVASRINPGAVRIALEICCGTGRVTRHLRQLIPAASGLIASDISEDMMAVAKEKLKTAAIDWQIIDAQNLPFDDNSIDLVVCCFGYMFVSDKNKALSEAYRILRKGGMLIFSTWDDLEKNGVSYIYREVAKKYLEEPLPENYYLPFSMTDQDAIKKNVQRAGFSKVVIEAVKKESVCTSARDAARGLAGGGSIYNEIMKRNPLWIDEIIETVEKKLGEKYCRRPMVAPMSAVVCQAWK